MFEQAIYLAFKDWWNGVASGAGFLSFLYGVNWVVVGSILAIAFNVYTKIKELQSMKKEEQRKDELHSLELEKKKQELEQDKELHNKKIKEDE